MHKVIASKLKEDIVMNNLKVHLQPIFSNLKQEIVGFEALIRNTNLLNYNVHTIRDFVDLIEEAEVIDVISDFVFNEIIVFLNKIKNDKLEVSINISPSQIESNYLYNKIKSISDDNKLVLDRIKVELTENKQTKNIKQMRVSIEKIKALGVKFSLDDFGRAYSSFELLSYIDFDCIKIDKRLIMDIENNDKTKTIIESISKLTNKLKIILVCEGVETDNQNRVLKGMGIDFIQGYLIDEAIPISEVYSKYKRVIEIDNTKNDLLK